MIIQPDFLTHWKVQALSGLIGRAEALTALLALWGHCQNSKTWVFELTLPMLAGICQYQGNAADLHQAMLDCRLVDRLENGCYEVHGWAEKNAMLLKSWDNGNKGGRPSNNPRVNLDPKLENPEVNLDPQSRNPRATHGSPDREIDRRIDRVEGEERENGPDGRFRPTKISWSHQTGWTGFTPELRATLAKSFPGKDLDLACNETDAWLRLKPGNATKKNWFSFLTNWLRRSSLSAAQASDEDANVNYGKKNEGGPPAMAHYSQPDGPWVGAFQATYGRFPDGGWAALPPAIQREVRDTLRAADALLLASFQAAEKNEGGRA